LEPSSEWLSDLITSPEATIVIPAYNEGENIVPGLNRLLGAIKHQVLIFVVVDSETDTTIEPVKNFRKKHSNVNLLINTYGRGPANAIRFGINSAHTPVVLVTMADGCDDPRQIDELIDLVNRGVVVAAASRYMPGGQQVGGPRFKAFLSKTAGKLLHWFAGVGTRDSTNSFKAYSLDFVKKAKIESTSGFEIGLELTAKARRLRLPIAEVPTIWLDRQFGESNFMLKKWLPAYLKWFKFAFGKKITYEYFANSSQDTKKEENI
jgi:glycosyltransferase involved in cell wall biosynthesis